MFIFLKFKNFEPCFAQPNLQLQIIMYIYSHMLYVLPVYLLSMSVVYLCIIFIWNMKQADVGG